MTSTIRIAAISGLALITLLAFLCSFQVAHGFKHLFKAKKIRPYDDYDSASEDHRSTRKIAKLKASAANWETFSKSPLFLEPVDEGLTQIPPKQLEFEYETGRKNIALFKELVRDAIQHKDDYFSATKLITKWGFKVIQVMIKNRRDEMKIEGRYEPKNFFPRIADALLKMVDLSSYYKSQKGYDRKNVDVVKLEERSSSLLDYADRILEISPVGIFLKWDTMKLFMDDPNNPLHKKDGLEEVADVFAQFRAIGYDSAAFMAKRIAEVLKTFAKGQIPKSARQFV